jgi:hypothetical protein
VKRYFFVFILCFAAAAAWGQTSVVDILRAKQQFSLGQPYTTVTQINVDTLLTSASNQQLVTALAVKKYADKLGGRAVATTAPVSGQALVWDGTKWTPATVSGAGVAQPTGQIVVGSGAGVTSDTFFTYTGQRLTLDVRDPDLSAGPSYGIDLFTKAATNGETSYLLRAISATSNLSISENAGAFSIVASGRLNLTAQRLAISVSDSITLPGYTTVIAENSSEKTLLALSSSGRLVRVEGIGGTQINQMAASTGQALVWDGTKWAPATVSGAGVSKSYETFIDFTGTNLTPTASIPATNREWKIDLYRTGVRMQYLQDFTISGSDIVLTLAASNEDFVLIITN